MSDFTSCTGDDCPLKASCYRSRRLVYGRRATFSKPPFDPATGQCDRFWDIADQAPDEAAIRLGAYHIWLAAGRPDGEEEAHWLAAEARLRASHASRLDEGG